MTKKQCALAINGFELNVHLGWSDHERIKKQSVSVDIDIYFFEPPKAIVSDELQDTLCYSDLIKVIQQYVQEKQFKLIEHLTYEIYTLIKSRLPEQARMMVHLVKHPPIDGFSGQVRFSYGDNK